MVARRGLSFYGTIFVSFLAGFLSTLIFHQGFLWGVMQLGYAIPGGMQPWNFSMMQIASFIPFGIPAVISLAFWGGVWGLILWVAIRAMRPAAQSIGAVIIGACAPTIVGILFSLPDQGIVPDKGLIIGALMVNAVWAIGTLSIIRIMLMFRPVD